MVMVAEVDCTKQPGTAERHARRAAAWPGADGPGTRGPRSTPSRLDAGVRSLLGSDAKEFIERQWQPFGE